MTESISAIVQFKRMTAAQWQTSSYVPKESELVFETDTGYAKFGNGRDRYPQLKYLTGPKGEQGERGLQGVPGKDGKVTFEALTQEQKNQLKGHSLTGNVRINGSYRNNQTSQLEIITDVYYDGTRLNSGYTVDYYWRGFGNNNWQSQLAQSPDSNGKIAHWNAATRNGDSLEVYCVVNYQGLKVACSTRIDNVNDGARGANGVQGARGAQGEPGQNIVNQRNQQPLKYWYGSKSEFDSLTTKDANTIYDIYEAVQL